MQVSVLALLATMIATSALAGSIKPPQTDYLEMLKQEIQGKKSGFLAGNKVYYIGGRYTVWNLQANETIGLTHPIRHDLISRGIGVAYYEGVGTGNDFSHWEWYKDTHVAYGSVIIGDKRYEHPAPEKMYWQPDQMRCEYTVANVTITEQKFVAENDVISTIISSSAPITIEIDGQSFAPSRDSTSNSARCLWDERSNAVHVHEGGRANAQVYDKPSTYVEGPIMYQDLTTVLTASKPLKNVEIGEISPGVCNYTFQFSVDQSGTTLSWAMDSDYSTAWKDANTVLQDSSLFLKAKSNKMNGLLNNEIPYFRCSDDDIVKVYYFLQALNLMYVTDIGVGNEIDLHTQTAVNNFLGMHRYDAIFQIRVGSWLANNLLRHGNVLTWKRILDTKQGDALPDNKGQHWTSGVYGSAIGHVCGAWQVYEHSGDKGFLEEAYEFYKDLFSDGISNMMFGYGYDAGYCLGNMTLALDLPESEALNWHKIARLDSVMHTLNNLWEVDTPDLYGAGSEPDHIIGNSNFAYMGMSMFPDEWAQSQGERWLSKNGKSDSLFDSIPLASSSPRDWDKIPNKNFMHTPDTNWWMIRGLYVHNVNKIANDALLGHLKTYNMEWGIPIAPEGRRADGSAFGDQYSNFNAGKIILLIEGTAGLSYSVVNNTFTHADTIPDEWSFMEWYVPINAANMTETEWVHTRVTREETNHVVSKTIEVENEYFENVILHPWTEDATMVMTREWQHNWHDISLEDTFGRNRLQYIYSKEKDGERIKTDFKLMKGMDTESSYSEVSS